VKSVTIQISDLIEFAGQPVLAQPLERTSGEGAAT
jgi:hypothetical protein